MIINVVGATGAGKTTACRYLVQSGFTLFRPSDVIREYAKRHGRAINGNKDYIAVHKEVNTTDPDALIRPILQSHDADICIDGLRTPLPYAKLRASTDAHMIALTAPAELRLARLRADETRTGHRAPQSLEELEADELADLYNEDQNLPNLEVMIKQADYTIGTGTLTPEAVGKRLSRIITHLRN